IIGPDTARVVLVEFADPNCPACRRAHPEVKALLERFEGKIQYAFRTLPLYQIPGHETSINLGLALEYAAEKGRHKEMMDVIFDPQNTDMIKTDAGVLQAVKNAGLDSTEFSRILEEADEEAAAKRQELFDKLGVDFSTAQSWGIRSTPTFILYTEGSRPKAMYFGSVLRSLSIEPLASLLEK
ncbi:MAG: DsbA family protein, partial [Fimbriimonadaceae bacterium]|nr:DsbA family protein [Fimbriimonadaceae bacterium]